MKTTEWCNLSIADQEQHMFKLSRLAKMAFPNAKNPFVSFDMFLFGGSNWKLVVGDEIGRNFLYIAHDDALDVAEEVMRQLAGVGLYWKAEV